MMKKAVVGGLVAVAIIAGSIFIFSEKTNETSNAPSSETAVSQTEPVDSQTKQQPVASTPTQAGQYLAYSDDVIAKTTGTKLLFFHAPWCPQCRMLDEDIKKQGVPEGVSIIKIDYDTNQSLRRKYGVTLQTTLVKVDDNGNLIKKYVAYDEPNLAAVKKNLL